VESQRARGWIADEIRRFVREDPGNRLGRFDGSPIFDEPLVGFGAGLGSFGLSDGLITPVGIAHRVGSVIVDLRFESPSRPENIHRDCLSYRGLGCRDCEKRCPTDAISESGHDKQRCSEFVFGQIPLIKREYEVDIYACGLCQVGVPCEAAIPQRRQSKS
jgi:epoxyqueuosine reductase QueG